MSKTQPARGMRDFLPSDVRKRNYVVGIIKEVYESYGFEPLETPAVENIETLTGKYGEEGNQLIFKILKRGEKLDINDKELADLALRYDLTVPLARVVAQHKNDLPKFFKRYQIQPVWRADRPARGRFREFYQCDVDAIGSSSMIVEAELCSAVCEILQRLGFDDFTIRINSRKLLAEILNQVEIPYSQHTDALIAIDKLDKIGIDGVLSELDERGIEFEKGEKLIDFFRKTSNLLNTFQTLFTTTDSIISAFSKESKNTIESTSQMINEAFVVEFSKFFESSESIYSGLIEIEQILNLMEKSGAKGIKRVVLDPSLARGLSYYTGTIFEVRLEAGDFAGSIGGGGRYDGLIGMFGKEQIPACGFSLGLERILVVMEERGMFQKLIDDGKLKLDSADVLVTNLSEESTGEALRLAGDLRRAGLRVVVYPETAKLDKQLKYASQLNVEFVCILGENELAENKVTVKNLRTREQQTVESGEIYRLIKKI